MKKRIYVALSLLLFLSVSAKLSFAQIVINEVAYQVRGQAYQGQDEFVELYNAGDSAVDIGGWSLTSFKMDNENTSWVEHFSDPIPSGTSLAAGDFYVLGDSGVPNLDQDLGFGDDPVDPDLVIDLWPNSNTVLELRDGSSTLIDALVWEANKVTVALTPEVISEVGAGWWGNTQSHKGNTTDGMVSLGRFLDGRDTNNNGRDFGQVPRTPGEPSGLAINPDYAVPDVDGLAPLSAAPGFMNSFVGALVIDPTVADASVNETAIPASPQGGNAMIAWDSAGGGNMAASTELVYNFDIWAYIETTPYGEGGMEATTYGIGTTGTLFNIPNPSGADIGFSGNANGNTGIGWIIQKEDSSNLNTLFLVDMNDGGPSNPSEGDWTVIQTIDLSSFSSDWYRLSIDYDPITGEVLAIFDDQTFEFTSATDLVGTFYIGYRESLASSPPKLRPPTFDLYVDSPDGLDGDYNGDGVVDLADYTVWRNTLGATGADLAADGNGDMTVDAADYGYWKERFGDSLPGDMIATATVPEPSSVVVALVLLLGVAARGRAH